MTTPPPDPIELAHFEEMMTMSEPPVPLPAGTSKVAPKVKWSAVAAAIIGAVLAAIPGLLSNTDIVSGVPDWVTALVLGVLTGGGAGAIGYAAPHQPRVGDDPLLDEVTAEDAGPIDHDYHQGEAL